MGKSCYENIPISCFHLPLQFRHPLPQIRRFVREANDFADGGNGPDAARLEQQWPLIPARAL